MTWSLGSAGESDVDKLMTWFPDAHSVDIWGGPKFRYPFDRKSFHEDCRWREFSSYCLRNSNGDFAAFGQIGTRYKRTHLARLVSNPQMRRQGIGRRLLEAMFEIVRAEQNHSELGLFVYKDNAPAYQCYLALGFEVQEYPEDAPLRDECYYLTRASLA